MFCFMLQTRRNASFLCKGNCLPSLMIQTFLLCYRQEEMYQLLISNYEEKQQELRVENNDLRECLVHMQRELSAILNNTDFSSTVIKVNSILISL